MKFRSWLFAVALAACSPPPVTETAPDSAPPGVSAEFMTPTGNIGCIYTPAGGTAVYQTADGRAELKCDRSDPDYVRVVLSETGAARIEPTDERGCCSGEVIQYGQTWSEGPFGCDITDAGITCISREQHGFTLNRSRSDVH